MLWMLLWGCGDELIAKGTAPTSEEWPTERLAEVGDLTQGMQFLDAREAADFEVGHIAGSVHANWQELTAFDEDGLWGPSEREAAAALLAERGLRADGGPIVIYDDWGSGYYGGDGYLYWTLRSLGAQDVRLLNGGWSAWLSAGGVPSTNTREAGDFAAVSEVDVLATTEEVAEASEQGTPLLLDVRSAGEWADGHIPGATHFEWDRTLADGRLLPPDELAAVLAEVGLDDPTEPVITYCAGGIRAGQTFFVLELMGFTSVQDYVGSWAAWSTSGGPVNVP